MIKKIVLSAVIVAFAGCGEESQKQSQIVPKIAEAPQIEIVANENAKAIKVAQKEQRDRNSSSSEDTYYYDYNVKSEYDQNSRPANADASVRVKPRTQIEANMNVRSPYEKVELSLLVGKLSKTFIVKCSACHSDYANGVIGPSLLGKSSDEIFNNIQAFKSGKKSNVLMDGLINQMEDAQIRELADEIYSFNKKINEMRK
jgi:cytochrome c553